ncbi:MAG: hypothetical protein M1320_01495 [Patescibacteria group bacterium]|nr:hypothetical protein [Patescibacteria group bacterium]
MLRAYQEWRLKKTFLLLASIVLFLFIFSTSWGHGLLDSLNQLGYVGVLIAGVFFVFSFTVAPATIVLYHLAQTLNLWWLGIIAGIGAAIGDFFIFRSFQVTVFEELKLFFQGKFTHPFWNIFRHRAFGWAKIILGSVIIISPFPDEVGLGLLGLSNIKAWQFLLLTFVLNVVGIVALLSLIRAV